MSFINKFLVSSLIITSLSAPLYAEEVPAVTGDTPAVVEETPVATAPAPVTVEEVPVPKPWQGEAELGYISTAGNSETETLNFKTKFIHERLRWKNTFKAEATKTSDNGGITAQRSFAGIKTDYKYTARSYLFGLFEYEENKFSGYVYQSNLVVGYGKKIINRDSLKWDAEIGYGNKQSQLKNAIATNSGIVYLSTELDWKLSDTASFNEKLTVESGEATTTKSVSGLISKINSKLASKITYTVKHVDKVPAGVKNTDRELAVTLVYSF